ncbi:MAG: SDR family NAD(P)-dependent oxidoreductase [Hyphomicrobiales bacterium]
MRLKDKVAIVVGAGQTPGETIGNGRATAILFAREGARVLLVDRDKESAEETRAMIAAEGGEARVFQADVTDEAAVEAMARTCVEAYGRIDVLQNNVGIGAGDATATRLDLATWQRIFNVNLTGMFLTCKYVVPVMREQASGSIINISSVASVCSVPMAAYKTSKAGVNAFTQHIAAANARYGIRANAILPGLLDTPMAVEGNAEARGMSREDVREMRSRRVPLRRQMGTAWDTAYASLFLASDEAQFITGVLLPVDGGQSIQVG